MIAIKVIKNTAKQFVSSLKKESMKASRKSIGRCGILLRNQARRNLKTSGIKITDSHFGDKLIQGVRAGKTFRKDNSFKRYVRITKSKRKATHFYNNALASFDFAKTYNDEMNKQLSKMKK